MINSQYTPNESFPKLNDSIEWNNQKNYGAIYRILGPGDSGTLDGNTVVGLGQRLHLTGPRLHNTRQSNTQPLPIE